MALGTCTRGLPPMPVQIDERRIVDTGAVLADIGAVVCEDLGGMHIALAEFFASHMLMARRAEIEGFVGLELSRSASWKRASVADAGARGGIGQHSNPSMQAAPSAALAVPQVEMGSRPQQATSAPSETQQELQLLQGGVRLQLAL